MSNILKRPFFIITGFFILFIFVVAVIALASSSMGGGAILHVELDGELHEVPIADPASLFSDYEPLTVRALVRAIRTAATDDDVVGLVLEVRNPVVGVAQLQEIEEAMAVFRATGKWNLAFLETAGEFSRGDGAFALAATAGEILLAPSGEINLVGVRAEVPFLKGTLKKLDVEVHMEKRHAYKNAANMFTEDHFTAEHREALTAVLDDLQTEIATHLAARRDVGEGKVREWLATGPHDAKAALELGLVDELAYWDTVRERVRAKSDRDEPLVSARRYAALHEDSRSGPAIALITAEGAISRGESDDGLSGPAIGSDTMAAAFREAREAEVTGVLFRVDSPGGSYIASDIIRREVEVTRAAGIPVVVSMGNVAASGGYFVAMQADRIIAQPGTITGSIGVLAGRFALRGFYRNYLGVTFDTYETSPAAGIFSSLDPPSDSHKKRIAAALDRIYEDFVNKAADGRKKTFEDIHAVAQGRVWSGRAALERGLVDELGGVQLAMTRLKELAGIPPDQTVAVQLYPKPKTGLDLLFKMIGGGARLPSELRGVIASLHRMGLSPAEGALVLPFVPEI